MIVAIAVLLIVITLAAAAISAAVQTNQVTRRDANYKNALEAAEAGLQVALYRLNTAGLSSDSQCFGDAVEQNPDNGIWCTSSTYTLGNGSTYQYDMSEALGPTQTCAGLPLAANDVDQRCITSAGTSNGVTARSQIRAGAFAATPLFLVPGVTALTGATLSGSAVVAGSVASNGKISASGSASESGIVLGPAGTFSNKSNAPAPPVTNLPAPIVLAPVNTGSSATSNDNGRIVNGLANPAVVPYDQASGGGVTYNASTRTLTLSGGGTSLTLGGAVYNFCELDLSGGSTLSIAPGASPAIYIDSPSDTGSGCPSNTGNLTVSGGSNIINPSLNPLSLQMYVYGLNNGSGTVTLSGSSAMYGTVYAPQSNVTLSGSGTVTGGIVGRTVTISGAGAAWDPRAGTLKATPTGTYYRTAWAQCSPAPTTSDPGSGC